MSNPINKLSLRLEVYQRDLSELQEKYKNLKEEHRKLVKDAVETERNLDEFKDYVSRMCDGCTSKNTENCHYNCSLHKLAIKYNLWS